ncbi:MAG: sugar transferase [Candidatus Geothermincolia bacterium]
MKNKAKRMMDICLSAACLMFLAPAFLAIAVAIRLTSAGPVIFAQTRVGIHGREFNIYKFRSMSHGAENATRGRYITTDEPMVTPLGRKLRRWALDELPQLLNVLKGDMSIVGPRPTLGYQVQRYTPFQMKRLDVKPGITGWAQVNGRNKISWPERIEMDVWYAENWSISLDIRIILMTIPVLLRKDVAFAGEDTADDELVRYEDGGQA